jgi:NhaP-type Na+/H+ or K+/H+ antiporter
VKKVLAWRRAFLPVLLWVVFGSGLLVQAFAPRLEIENNAFVIPPSLFSESKEVHPAQIVGRERRLQALSAFLTLGGAVGLAFYYRRVFVRPSSP